MKKASQPLSYGFLDESSSLPSIERYFIIALLSASNPRSATWSRIVKRSRRQIGKKYHVLSELKFGNSSERTRRFLLAKLAKQPDIEVAVMVVDKVE